MYENKANYIKIGFFVLSGFGLILLAIGIAGARVLNRNEIYAETYIAESVTGLEVGSAVKYRGVPIGTVKRIGFVYSEYGNQVSDLDASASAKQILVVMALNPVQFLPLQASDPNLFLEELINTGMRVKVASQGITGLSYIEIDYFPADPKVLMRKDLHWTPKFTYIPSAPSTFFTFKKTTEELIIKFNQLNLQGLADELFAVLNAARTKINEVDAGRISNETVQLLEELRTTRRSVHALVDSSELQKAPAELAATLGNARRITERVEGQIDPLLGSFKGVADRTARLADSLAAIATNTGARVEQTAASLTQTVQTMNRITASQQDGLSDLIQNLRSASAGLNQLISELQSNPASLVFGQPPKPLPETR